MLTWTFSEALHVNAAGGNIPLYGVLAVAGATVILHVLLAWAARLYQGRSAAGSFEEMFVLASVVAIVGGIVAFANMMAPDLYVSRTTTIVATLLALIFCAWPCGLWRILVADAKPNRFGVVSTRG